MENMKEKIPMIIAVFMAILICGLAYYFLEYHQTIYYTQVDNTKIEQISSLDNMKYQYTLECYSESGRKKVFKFKTSRELKEDAYLRLEVKTIGVHMWEEVQYEELPNEVKINYKKD